MGPSSEECAKRILNVFKECEMEEGGSLLSVTFTEPFNRRPWTNEDFQRGADAAVLNGWIKVEDEMLRLTRWGEQQIT